MDVNFRHVCSKRTRPNGAVAAENISSDAVTATKYLRRRAWVRETTDGVDMRGISLCRLLPSRF